ncbi:hypothetical protein [Paraburkholderia caffeinilytica]|uniref:hypothetical protein n=1 Tax=Paraburkholderia caffeinilytica TaxID=1761016 RepID=UPI003DA19F51
MRGVLHAGMRRKRAPSTSMRCGLLRKLTLGYKQNLRRMIDLRTMFERRRTGKRKNRPHAGNLREHNRIVGTRISEISSRRVSGGRKALSLRPEFDTPGHSKWFDNNVPI